MSNVWLYVLIPLIPTVFWILYFYRLDKFAKEPKRLVFYSVLLGILVAFYTAYTEGFLLDFSGLRIYLNDFSVLGLASLFIVGIVEEGAKFFALRFSFYRSKYFDEISDGILYAVGIGLGFALIENIFYALRFGLSVTSFRAVSGPIFHASAAAVSGYYLARAKIEQKPFLGWIGLVVAILVHAVSDFLLTAAGTIDPAFFYIFAIFDLAFVLLVLFAYDRARKKMPVTLFKIKTEPTVATALSLVPGFGLFYLNKWYRAFAFGFWILFLFMVSRTLAGTDFNIWSLVFLLAAVTLWLKSVFVSLFTARKNPES